MGERLTSARHAEGRFERLDPHTLAVPIHACGCVRIRSELWHYLRGPHWISAGPKRLVSRECREDAAPDRATVQAHLSRADAVGTEPPARRLDGDTLRRLHLAAVDVAEDGAVPALVDGIVVDLVCLGMALPWAAGTERLWLARDGDVLLLRGPRLRFALMKMRDDTEPALELWPDGVEVRP